MKKSLVLLSGGVDSTTALYWSLKRHKKVHALTFNYGQRHSIEISIAQKLARKLKVPHKIFHVDLKQVGGSSLTDMQLPLPEYKKSDETKENIPSTYVPFRNGIFLALAAAWAETKGIREIVCGFNIIDCPNYPDTRMQFVKAMEEAINCGTKASLSQEKMRILTPFLKKKKSEIIKDGLAFGVDYSYTISCYFGKEIPCQKCASCILRQKAWEEVGIRDPLIIRLEKEGKK